MKSDTAGVYFSPVMLSYSRGSLIFSYATECFIFVLHVLARPLGPLADPRSVFVGSVQAAILPKSRLMPRSTIENKQVTRAFVPIPTM
jgi:hypothetical protein